MRTTIYVDGFNLYNRRLKNKPKYKWLNLKKLADEILDPQFVVQRVNYYTANVSGKIDPEAPARQRKYFLALKTVPEIQIFKGSFSFKERWAALVVPPSAKPVNYVWPQNLPELVRIHTAEEKGSDVNLASHLVRDALTDQIDAAFVITNDTDLIEPMRIAKEEAGKIVGLLSPIFRKQNADGNWDDAHIGLRNAASFTLYIHNLHFSKAQFPQRIPGTAVLRPATWV
jgi:uncharacterized LabA/DUF88 family protein